MLTTTATVSMQPMSKRLDRLSCARMPQNCLLIWLDRNIDAQNNDHYRTIITQLRQIANTVHTFTDVDQCIDFITNIEEEKTFVIVSGMFSEVIVPTVQEISQVSCVYIFCQNNSRYEQWAQQWSKVKGVFTDIKPICEALKQTAQIYDQNFASISFVRTSDQASNQNLDQLDPSFMYTQILKEILVTIDFEPQHFKQFITYCRKQFTGNVAESKNVDKLEREYQQHQPIWWYTSDSFLYSLLNKALRTMEVDVIIEMGFFVRDLHNHIIALHSEQYNAHNPMNSFTVYRGQGLSKTDFDQLMKTKDGLMSFNSFLSTSLDRVISLFYAESNACDPDLIGILFTITVDPSIRSTPFANVCNASYFEEVEGEILFSMHSIFRIGEIKQINKNDRVWQVDLALTNDNDLQLHAVTESMRKEIRASSGWDRLGHLMIKVGQFKKAEELYEILLKKTTNEDEKSYLYHMLGLIKIHQGDYANADEFYGKLIKIQQKILSPIDPNLTASYNNIGLVYDKMGEYSKALSFLEKALEIQQNALPPNHPDLATSYNNIAGVYNNIGEYSKALSFLEKALEIFQKTLSPNHPSLATSYNNIGGVYDDMGDYSKALSFYEKAFEIDQKTLPPNHPDLATSYNNIGTVYYNIGEYSKALSFYEKALEIEQKTLPPNHPLLATSYNNIGLVYDKMGEYSKALSFNEKALEIRQKNLPPNHPSLATSYNNIGAAYYKMREYSKALSFNEKALEIKQKTLPPNHPDLTTSYNNIARVYDNMGEYSKALSFNEKALEIQQKTLPPNHPYLATSYNNIGGVYDNMGEYEKALSFYEKALEIFQKTLPPSHPDLAIYYNNIGGVYYGMGEYSKALSFCEKALEIEQKIHPSNHPDLTTSYNNIARVYDNMGEYSKALSFYERARDILQLSLPANHCSVENVQQNIQFVKKKLRRLMFDE
jgi:tetratricopeptide (TPR) repeat protein